MNTSAVKYAQQSEDYQRIEKAIMFLEANYRQQPSLQEISASINLSEYHFQRLFTRWVGISPKRFLQYITKESAKELLENSQSLLDVAYEIGLSGPGRLHDLFVNYEAVTPGEYKQRGTGLTIRYGFHPTPFGECLLAVTERGICSLAFVDQDAQPNALDALQNHWKHAALVSDQSVTSPLVSRIFSPPSQRDALPINLVLSGTNFQIKVWEALLRIPSGLVVSYADVAAAIGQPSASRAVSNAVAHNHIAFVIPCHRVIRKLGEFGGYGYGTARKKALIAWEQVVSQGHQ